jgi:hypothetical protein
MKLLCRNRNAIFSGTARSALQRETSTDYFSIVLLLTTSEDCFYVKLYFRKAGNIYLINKVTIGCCRAHGSGPVASVCVEERV